MLKKRKTNANATAKQKSSKTGSGAPKRPAGASLIFMEEFRKEYKQNFPDNKSISAVKDRTLIYIVDEKAPYVANAAKRKAEYEQALEAYIKTVNEVEGKNNESDKSTSKVHDDE
uniref:HMG box domain-containing protein n=1 Tax=Nelumbo nucifera TaxID=4432 RepID=A0A822XSV1_NELNU|nr:TPA_asm: hypothetical protein HUJ06_021991 [Nelumbo nucifera]